MAQSSRWTPAEWRFWLPGFFKRHRCVVLGRCYECNHREIEVFTSSNDLSYCRSCWQKYFQKLGAPVQRTLAESSVSSARAMAKSIRTLSPIPQRVCRDGACNLSVQEESECEFCTIHCCDDTCTNHGARAMARGHLLLGCGLEDGTELTGGELCTSRSNSCKP